MNSSPVSEPIPGILSLTHRQEGDNVVYTAKVEYTRDMALKMISGRPVFVTYPREEKLTKQS